MLTSAAGVAVGVGAVVGGTGSEGDEYVEEVDMTASYYYGIKLINYYLIVILLLILLL